MTPDSVTVEAPAKVNLTLEVLGKRHDGYHDIASVMQTISLFDTLTFTPADHINVSSNVSDLNTRDNLVYRAAVLLKDEIGVSEGADIRLEKVIPLDAGLGGGSSDAAGALLGLDRLWGLGLLKTQLKDLAARLGSDVPFFLRGGSALVEGRGERVSALGNIRTMWFVLAFPRYEVDNKTGRAYGALRRSHYTDGEKTADFARQITQVGEFQETSLFNVFEQVASQLYPGIDHVWSVLEEVSGQSVHLSGAGPTLFCLVDGPITGEAIVRECGSRGLSCDLARTLGPGEGPRIRVHD